uniref:Uncharacterized protein n=1 Tax=Panagrolaimus davidi TaxID=227884 RepID=A0A914QSF9_9BILA
MSLAQTLCNIFNTPLPSNADVVTTESNDADTSEEEEEYYVCLECERLGNKSHNHYDNEPNMDGNQNVGEEEKEDILSASSVSLNHALESTSSQNLEKETTDLPDNSFTPSVFEDLDEAHNTGTIGSSAIVIYFSTIS